MTKNTISALLVAGFLTTLIAGCSGDDEYVFEHGPAGPNTERTLETLPEGIRADKSQASHTEETLEPID